MKNLHKLATELNKKYNLRKQANDDVEQLKRIITNYESKAEFLGIFIQALDAYVEQTTKELDPIENALDIEEIQKQAVLIEGAINSVINEVSAIDDAWSSRQTEWLDNFKGKQ